MIADEPEHKDIEVRQTDYGRGLFARANLPSGVVVIIFSGQTVATYEQVPEEMRCHTAALSNGSWVLPKGNARYLNHSCEPNCEVEADLTVVTIRPIVAGEQLTISYDGVNELTADFWDPVWSFDCRCGAPSCVGRIDRYRVHP